MKKKDLILVGAVLVVAVCFLLGHFCLQELAKDGTDADNSVIVQVTFDGVLYGEYSLTEETEFDIQTAYGFNHLIIQSGEVWVSEADCGDHTCMKMGKIGENGGLICCLPHRLLITCEHTTEDELDAFVN